MAENKTRATDASVEAYLAAIDGAERRADCHELLALMAGATGEPPVMWGAGMVGFGRYHYRYDSGREGNMMRTGFAARKGTLVVYLMARGTGHDALLGRLGQHKAGQSCLYIRRLADVDRAVLAQLIAASLAELPRHPA